PISNLKTTFSSANVQLVEHCPWAAKKTFSAMKTCFHGPNQTQWRLFHCANSAHDVPNWGARFPHAQGIFDQALANATALEVNLISWPLAFGLHVESSGLFFLCHEEDRILPFSFWGVVDKP
ncbi:MAG: hypothetical protein AB7P49_21425, partial [Bdellovibrionales bacterium]